jgi:hypothetical protein
MAIGDLTNFQIKIGGVEIDYPYEVDIFEDMTNSMGPAFQCRIVDEKDNAKNFNGSFDQDIEVNFSDESGGNVGFKFKQLESSDLTDGSKEKQGSLNSKSYTIKGVCQEFFNAQGNYVQNSFSTKTTSMVESVLKNNYKTDKPITIEDESSETRNIIASNKHPTEFLQGLNEQHVSQKNPSSLYAVFQEQENNQQKYVVTTFEERFKRGPVATIKQSTTLDSSEGTEEDKRNSIMWMNVGQNFFSGTQHYKTAKPQYVNLTTHKVTVEENNQEQQFATGGQPVIRGKPTNAKEVPVDSVYSKVNEPNQRVTHATAKANRAKYTADLAQNSAEVEIPGNPKIKIGSTINMEVPNRTGEGGSSTPESQFGDKVLVTKIRHKIKPAGQTPRYTMVLTVVKAGFAQGGTA